MTYKHAVELLRQAGIEDAERDAAILFEHFAGFAAHTLPFRKNEEAELPELDAALARRLAREPLQYILRRWEFCGLQFELNADCLCPRPDTELIVELAVKELPPRAHFCDIGTGSGAIAVSVLHMRRDTTADACDISEGALSAARTNAELNAVADRLSIFRADALDEACLAEGSYDAVISNPPYIPSAVIPTLEREVLYEPLRALDGGEDGLRFYRAITASASAVLKPNGFILYEVGCDQAESVAAIGERNGFSSEIYRDLSGIRRAVLLRRAE